MFSIDTINTGFYTWASFVVNPISVIWFNPNAPRPARPYLTLSLNNFDAAGFDYETAPDNDGMASHFGNRELTLEINYFGNQVAGILSGMDVLNNLQTSLMQPNIKELLYTYGIVFVNRLTILSTAALLDTKYEERLILELRFRVSNQGITAPSVFEVGLIEVVNISGDAVSLDGSETEVDFDVIS